MNNSEEDEMTEDKFGEPGRRDRERHLLAAVDESDNSLRTVQYLADFFAGNREVFVTLLTVIPMPDEDYFPDEEEQRRWLENRHREMKGRHERYRRMLLEAGFAGEQVRCRLIVHPCCTSIADAILEEQAKLRCCMVVVGRRGISRREEFVFGSTSSRILHQATNCAVLVVE